LLANAWQMAPKETTLYLFQSGWIDDKEEDWIAELRGLGGNPHNFGPNVLLCTIQRPKTPTPMLPSSARSR
jgi:hypothetical protein